MEDVQDSQAVLDVSLNVTPDDVKRAYARKRQEYLNGEQKTLLLNSAQAVLSDEAEHKKYDMGHHCGEQISKLKENIKDSEDQDTIRRILLELKRIYEEELCQDAADLDALINLCNIAEVFGRRNEVVSYFHKISLILENRDKNHEVTPNEPANNVFIYMDDFLADQYISVFHNLEKLYLLCSCTDEKMNQFFDAFRQAAEAIEAEIIHKGVSLFLSGRTNYDAMKKMAYYISDDAAGIKASIEYIRENFPLYLDIINEEWRAAFEKAVEDHLSLSKELYEMRNDTFISMDLKEAFECFMAASMIDDEEIWSKGYVLAGNFLKNAVSNEYKNFEKTLRRLESFYQKSYEEIAAIFLDGKCTEELFGPPQSSVLPEGEDHINIGQERNILPIKEKKHAGGNGLKKFCMVLGAVCVLCFLAVYGKRYFSSISDHTQVSAEQRGKPDGPNQLPYKQTNEDSDPAAIQDGDRNITPVSYVGDYEFSLEEQLAIAAEQRPALLEYLGCSDDNLWNYGVDRMQGDVPKAAFWYVDDYNTTSEFTIILLEDGTAAWCDDSDIANGNIRIEDEIVLHTIERESLKSTQEAVNSFDARALSETEQKAVLAKYMGWKESELSYFDMNDAGRMDFINHSDDSSGLVFLLDDGTAAIHDLGEPPLRIVGNQNSLSDLSLAMQQAIVEEYFGCSEGHIMYSRSKDNVDGDIRPLFKHTDGNRIEEDLFLADDCTVRKLADDQDNASEPVDRNHFHTQ